MKALAIVYTCDECGNRFVKLVEECNGAIKSELFICQKDGYLMSTFVIRDNTDLTKL